MKFRFEIQNCITVEKEGNSREEARTDLIDNIREYGDEMVDPSAYVSDGTPIEGEE